MFTSLKKNDSKTRMSSSPSIHDVRSRLNFSSTIKSPLLSESRMSRISPSSLASPRLSDYHMSRQHPAVLDHLYAGTSPLQKDSNIYKSPLTPVVEPNQLLLSPVGDGSVAMTRAGKRQSLVMASLMKHLFNNNHPLTGSSSIVQLAAKGGTSHGNLRTSVQSPVVIKLSDPGSVKTNMKSDDVSNIPVDPCDKNVVVSALKQKRKRWWSTASPSLDDPSIFSSNNNLPSKRTKTTINDEDVKNLPSLGGGYHVTSPNAKKRGLTRDPLTSAKRAKSNKRIILPDVEIELSPAPLLTSLATPSKQVDVPMETTKDASIEDKSNEQKRPREPTPPVQEEDEKETKAKKKREDTLKLKSNLTQVFPSPSRECSITRKKVPILCASGSIPPMVSFSSHDSVTEEAIKKDRETASIRVKKLLTSDDPEDIRKSVSLSTTSTTVTSQQAMPSISTTALVSGAGVSSGGLKLSSKGLNIGTGTLPSTQRTFLTSTSSISTVQSMPNLNVSLPSLTPITTPTVTTCASQGIQLGNLSPSMTTSQPAAQTNVTSILTNPIPAFSGASSTTGLIPTSVTQSLSLNLQPSAQPQGLNIGSQSAMPCSTLSLVTQSGGLGSGLKLSNALSLSQSGTQSGGTNPRLLTGLKIPNLTNPTSIQSQTQSTSLFQSNLIDKPVVTSTSSLALNSADTQSANIFRLSNASGSSQANSIPTAQSALSVQPTINSSVPSIAKSSGNFQFSLSNNTAFNFSTNQQNNSSNPLGLNQPLFGSASNGSQVTQSGLTLNTGTQQQTQVGGLQFGLGSHQQAQSSGFQVGTGSQQQSQSSGLQFGIGSQQKIQQQPQSSGLQFGSVSQQKQPQSNGFQFGIGSQQQPQTSSLKFGIGSQSSGLLFGTGSQQQSQIQAGSSLQQGSGLQFGAGFQQQQPGGGLQFGMPQSSQSGGLNFPSLSQQPLQFNLGSQQQQKQEGLQFNTGAGGVQQTGFQFNSNSQQQKTGGLFQSFQQQQQQQPATGLQFNTSQPQNATPNSGLLFNQQSSTKNTGLFGGGGTQTSTNPGIFGSGPQTSAPSNVFNPMSKPSFNFQQGSAGSNNSGNTLLFNQSSGQTGFNIQPNQLQIGQTNSIFPSGPQQTSGLPSFGGNQLANQSPFQFGTPGNQPGNLTSVGNNAPFSTNFNFVNNKTPQNVTPQPSNQGGGFNFTQGNMTPNTMNFSGCPSRPIATATRRRGGLRKK